MGPCSGTPAHLDTDGPKGWTPAHLDTESHRAGSPWPHTRSRMFAHMRAPDTVQPFLLSVWPSPPPRALPRAEAWPAGQSTFSTLPMIFSSKTGKMASSSRTSSNTTPQSNSSLTFLK